MLNSKEIRSIAEGTFEIRCDSMRLRKEGALETEGPSGPGYLRQLPTGGFSLLMFVMDQPPTMQQVLEPHRQSGQLLEPEDYYRLHARGFGGRQWTATHLRPHFSRGASDTWIAEATVREIREEYDLTSQPKGSSLRMGYRGELDFPFHLVIQAIEKARLDERDRTLRDSLRREAAKLSALGCGFFVRHDAGQLVVEVSSPKKRLPPRLEDRLNEALEFLLARRLKWAWLNRQEGRKLSGAVTGAPLDETRGRMPVPVDVDKAEAAIALLEKYLSHLGAHRGRGRPPLAMAVESVLLSAASPLDAHALDLAVAVEAILASEYADLGKPHERFESELQKVKSAIDGLEVSDEMKRRVGGSLRAMRQISAKSRLLELERSGVISREEVRAWDEIRHKAVHGRFIEDLDQKYLDHFFCLVMLMHRLIFNRIGYHGPYRDYSQPGWPWRERQEAFASAGLARAEHPAPDS